MKLEPTAAFDVFSLGAVLHWTLSNGGKLDEPYRVMSNRRSLAEQFGTSRFEPLDGLLDRMMQSDRQKRLQTMVGSLGIDSILGGLLGGAGFGTDCAFCGKGRYRDAGQIQLAGGTEINISG